MIARLSRKERIEKFLTRIVFYLSRPNTYVLIAVGLLALLIVGTFLIWEFESNEGGSVPLADFGTAFAYMLQSVSGVWLGAPSPQTIGGRTVALIVVIVAAALRALLIAAIVSAFVNRVLV